MWAEIMAIGIGIIISALYVCWPFRPRATVQTPYVERHVPHREGFARDPVIGKDQVPTSERQKRLTQFVAARLDPRR